MTVAELIAELQQLAQAATVVVVKAWNDSGELDEPEVCTNSPRLCLTPQCVGLV